MGLYGAMVYGPIWRYSAWAYMALYGPIWPYSAWALYGAIDARVVAIHDIQSQFTFRSVAPTSISGEPISRL